MPDRVPRSWWVAGVKGIVWCASWYADACEVVQCAVEAGLGPCVDPQGRDGMAVSFGVACASTEACRSFCLADFQIHGSFWHYPGSGCIGDVAHAVLAVAWCRVRAW